MRRPFSIGLVTLAVAALIMVGWYLATGTSATPASAATYCAPSGTYATIQAAINAAGDGDTVRIVYGTWHENLDITADITLEGGYSKECPTPRTYTDPQYTIIDGGAADHVVEITGGSTATLDGLTLTNGFAQKGGGVYVSGASPTLNNMVVTSNVISPTGTTEPGWAYGGGVFVENGEITLMECDITHNTSHPDASGSSEFCFGGGLALYGTFSSEGGAVIEGSHILSNTNPSGSKLHGGGLFLHPHSHVTFVGTDNQISYNEAFVGGGVYMYGNVDLEGVLILENHASIDGGGIVVGSGYNGGLIANNYLVDNSAGGDGPSIATCDVSAEIANNTIVGDLTGSGAGIDVIDAATGVLELTNNIVVNHAIGIRRNGSASVTLSHNDVWNNTTNYVGLSAGSSDISVDPEFVDPGSGDYHLADDSPCINAGTYVEGLRYDYDGDLRTGALLEIGADEYHMDPFFIPLAVRTYNP